MRATAAIVGPCGHCMPLRPSRAIAAIFVPLRPMRAIASNACHRGLDHRGQFGPLQPLSAIAAIVGRCVQSRPWGHHRPWFPLPVIARQGPLWPLQRGNQRMLYVAVAIIVSYSMFSESIFSERVVFAIIVFETIVSETIVCSRVFPFRVFSLRLWSLLLLPL